MRMRQSLAQFEAAFREETVEDRLRRERLRKEAAKRSHVRRKERVVRHSNWRFVGLVATIIGTTVLVTVVMFQMLALWFA
jgi:anti-sigma-K factor RskA